MTKNSIRAFHKRQAIKFDTETYILLESVVDLRRDGTFQMKRDAAQRHAVMYLFWSEVEAND